MCHPEPKHMPRRFKTSKVLRAQVRDLLRLLQRETMNVHPTDQRGRFLVLAKIANQNEAVIGLRPRNGTSAFLESRTIRSLSRARDKLGPDLAGTPDSSPVRPYTFTTTFALSPSSIAKSFSGVKPNAPAITLLGNSATRVFICRTVSL